MLHRIILVLTLLVAVSCTGDDTVVERVSVFCPTLDRVLMEDENCPDPPTTTPPTTTPPTTTPDTDTDRGAPTRSDCNIQVTIATSDVDEGRFEGTTGDDSICGNERNDVIDGRAGDDVIHGGAGNDILIGGDDRDELKGEAGNDVLRGGQDNDILNGGDGTDTADYSREDNPDTTDQDPVTVNLAEGHAEDAYGDEDTLESIEKVIGTSAADTITGGAEADIIVGGAGGDTLDGGAGTDDTLSYETETDAGVTISLAVTPNTATGGSAEGDTIKGFENVVGGGDADTLTGDDKANKLTGGGGNDTLTGGPGGDTLTGGAGGDILIGGTGRDTLTGGAGGDCFIVDARGTTTGDAETITDFNKAEDAITACGDISSVGDDAGEKLLTFSGSTIQRLTRASVEEDVNTDAIERVTPQYLSVATLSGSSTRLTTEEIAALAVTDSTIGNSNVTCTCPTN